MLPFSLASFKLILTNLKSIVCTFFDLKLCTVAEKLENLQSHRKVVQEWFGNNQIMTNPKKFQYMLFGKHKLLKIEIKEFQLEPT